VEEERVVALRGVPAREADAVWDLRGGEHFSIPYQRHVI
jgi:hypothetical protein